MKQKTSLFVMSVMVLTGICGVQVGGCGEPSNELGIQATQEHGEAPSVCTASSQDVDNNPCSVTLEGCVNGVKKSISFSVAQGTSCGKSLQCDGHGQCVGCTIKGMELPLSDQISGDCKTKKCNMQGVVIEEANPDDLPTVDPSCASAMCNGMELEILYKSIGESCDSNDARKLCNGSGTCVDCADVSRCKNGETCSAPSDCSTNLCDNDDKVCCDEPCSDACHSCKLGECTTVATGSKDKCAGNERCSKDGNCVQLDIGGMCSMDSDCLTGKCCPTSPKKRCGLVVNSPCLVPEDCCSNTCSPENVCIN